MQLPEIAAEKIRASATRARYRDFYDLYLLLEQPDTDVAQALNILQRKEIRAIVDPVAMAANWRQAQQEWCHCQAIPSVRCARQAQCCWRQ